MAKNFENANSINLIKDVAKTSNETANVIQVKMIKSENLIDYPKNNEDISDTIDLENSMKELGFTDPIEVTNFNMQDGEYMIVSGHRRRAAGVKVGIETFPCIIKNFSNEHELRNYVLLSNSQRDSTKDPLLFCKRYKMHYEYLKESGYEGSYRVEIAKRLGISVQKADRYNQFNKVILPVWDMVRDNIVGMSSVLQMASYTQNEQLEILVLLNKAYENGESLTREFCENIISDYRKSVNSDTEISTEKKQEASAIREEKPSTPPPTSSEDITHSSFSVDENEDGIDDYEPQNDEDFSDEKDEEQDFHTENKSLSCETKVKEKSIEKVKVYLSSEQVTSLIEYLPNILVDIKFSSRNDYENIDQLLQALKDLEV